LQQKTKNGPRADVTDVTITDYYASDASCVGGHLDCRAQVASPWSVRRLPAINTIMPGSLIRPLWGAEMFFYS